MQVFDESDLEHALLLELLELNGEFGQARKSGGAPAALPRDQLIVTVSKVTHQQRLKNAVAGNGVGKLFELFLVEFPAGLLFVGFNG